MRFQHITGRANQHVHVIDTIIHIHLWKNPTYIYNLYMRPD